MWYGSDELGFFRFGLGRVARLEEKYDEAAAYIERSLKLLPSFAESYTELGRIRMRQDKLEAARASGLERLDQPSQPSNRLRPVQVAR